MSQHCFNSTHEGQPVQITMGWDRPLQGFFMFIARTSAAPVDDHDVEDDGMVYSNLYDEELLPSRGFAEDVGYFQTKLQTLGLQVPERMLQEIRNDRAQNVGNRFVNYDGAGNPLDFHA